MIRSACILGLFLSLGTAPAGAQSVGPRTRQAQSPHEIEPPGRQLGESQRDDRARDAWIAYDKALHFSVSWAIVSYVDAGARLAGVDRDPSLHVAAATAAIAGIGKEIADRIRGRPFSLRDIAWDVAGIAVGLALARNTR